MGLVNQQAKYIPSLAEKTEPVRSLLLKTHAWLWRDKQKTAFDSIKEDLTRAPALALYDTERETTVSADASSYGLKAVIRQKQTNGELKPVA